MSTNEYTGPVIGVVEPGDSRRAVSTDEVIWQYGYRQPDGSVLLLLNRPRLDSPNVLRRPLVPAGEWRKAEEVNDELA